MRYFFCLRCYLGKLVAVPPGCWLVPFIGTAAAMLATSAIAPCLTLRGRPTCLGAAACVAFPAGETEAVWAETPPAKSYEEVRRISDALAWKRRGRRGEKCMAVTW